MAWSRWFDLTAVEVANEAPTTRGVYCIARRNDPIGYRSVPSLTVFIGMAPDRQRGLRAVLVDIANGSVGKLQRERLEHGGLRFCFQGNLGDGVEKLHQALIDDFEATHGEPPSCNRRD